MPYENPHATRASRPEKRPARAPREDQQSQTGSIAGFELLADPAVIASGEVLPEASRRDAQRPIDSEIEQLRTDLERQTRELEALRAGLANEEIETQDETPPAASPQRERPALDIQSATRLAREARRRERESREALESARAALSTKTRSPAADRAPATEETRPLDESIPRWTTHALVGQDLPNPSQLEEAIRDEIPVPNAGGEEGQVALTTTRKEIARLRARLASNERELEAREEERGVLRQTLHDREHELAARAEELTDTQEQFDAQTRILESTRVQLAHERSEHAATQELLSRLREVLGSALEPSSTQLVTPPREIVAARENTTYRDEFVRDSPPPLAPENPARAPAPSSPPALPIIFDAWLDDQIRRHFGPLGIDSLADLLQAPITRRVRIGGPDIQLVLLGRGAWRAAGELAGGLVRAGAPAFVIHVWDPAEPFAESARSLVHESPLHELLRPLPSSRTPIELDRELSSIGADVIVSRHFLSDLEEPEAWLDAFGPSRERGCALVFAERAGIEASPPPSAMSEIGDRIWQLMPERYKQIANGDETIESWTDIFGRDDAPAPNGCLAAMRRLFEFDLLARFGYLAEPFVESGIGGNFSPEASRDRRFLAQIAEVDDRKIEAGVAPALYLVALVEPASGEQGGTST